MMPNEKLKVGVVGVGGMGSSHCASCQEIDELKLVAVSDVDPDRAREVGEQFKVPYFVNHQDMLAEGKVEGVIIATPHYFHPVIAIDAFRAGMHVMSEKPIAVRVGMAERMIQAAEESGKIFCVMFQMRTFPDVRKARELVQGGELGAVTRTMLVYPTYRSQAYYDSGDWRATWAGEGGGVIMNQSPHIMDVFTSLGGMPCRVTGKIKTLIHDIEVEDHAEAILEYPNGAMGYFYVSTCEMPPGITVEVVGDKAKLRLLDQELSFWRYKPPILEFTRTNEAMWSKPEVEKVDFDLPPRGDGHRLILRNFARAVLFGEELISPGREGIQPLELANAIVLSSYKGEPVDVPIDRQEFHDLIEHLSSTSKYKQQTTRTTRETDPQFKG